MSYNYAELDDIRWLTKRQVILKRDDYKCVKCGETTSLEVHHLYYTTGTSLWAYPEESLVTLCKDCHQQWHDLYGVWYRDAPVALPKKRKKRRVRSPNTIRRNIIKASGFTGKDVSTIFKRTKSLSEGELKVFLKQFVKLKQLLK